METIKHRFKSRLRRLFSSCISVETGRIQIFKSLDGMIRGEDIIIDTPVLLEDIIQIMGKMDVCKEAMQSFAHQGFNFKKYKKIV